MNLYTVWYKKLPNNKAPEAVFLSDYTCAGVLLAENLKHLYAVIAVTQPHDSDLYDHRPLQIGDIAQLKEQFYILTPFKIWATVTAFDDINNGI